MGVVLYFGNELIEGQLGTGLWRRIAVLSLLVSAGGAVYALAILLFGAYRISELKSLLRRRATAPATSASE
jgi:putative peptidoglycan lipid II flippase